MRSRNVAERAGFLAIIEIEKDACSPRIRAFAATVGAPGIDLNEGGRSRISACSKFSRLDASIRMQREGGDEPIGALLKRARWHEDM